MYIAANSFIFDRTGHDLVDTVGIIASRGIRFLDISSNTSADPQDLPASARRDIVKAMADHGVTPSQFLMIKTGNIASADKKLRDGAMDYMKKCAEFQKSVGGRQVIVCVAGFLETGVPPEETWCHMLQALGHYAEWCAAMDMLVGVEMEPHVYYLLSDSWKLHRALDQLGAPNLYPNIDIGHLLITREAPSSIDKFAGRLYHGHLSDHDGMVHSNSVIGEGKVDFSPYLQRCKELGMAEDCRRAGIEPVFCLEIAEPGSDLDSAESWLDRSLAYLKDNVPEISL